MGGCVQCWVVALTLGPNACRYPQSCNVGTPQLSLVQTEPLKRKIFWDDTIQGASFNKVNCCLNDTTVCAAAASSAISCSSGTCSATVDFSSLVIDLAIPSDPAKVNNMRNFASNNYKCVIEYSFPPGTDVLKTDPATIACGLEGVGPLAASSAGISSITGDPEADGFFKIGNANESGVYARITEAANYLPQYDVYVTSFLWDDSISQTNGALQNPSQFSNGDLVIGVGYKVTQQGTVNPGDTLLKVDPTFALESYRPSTNLATNKDDDNGDGSGGAGECGEGRFFFSINKAVAPFGGDY